MTDLLDRMAAADPAREGERPPLDEVWRKIAADVATDGERARRGRWRRHGGRALLIAAAAAPVLAVIVIAVSGHGAGPRPATSP